MVMLKSSNFLRKILPVFTRESYFTSKMPPPDRWFDYSMMGNVIPGTPFICFKVPLRMGHLQGVNADDRFTPENAVAMVQEKGASLKMIVDLTFTEKYYNKATFTDQGIEHVKIFAAGHHIPADDVVHRFFDAVQTFKEENKEDSDIIGVHCTHGVNRTGYMVCRYMIEILAFSPADALAAFSYARGHAAERENYLADLQQRGLIEDYENKKTHKLPQKVDRSGQGEYRKNYNADRRGQGQGQQGRGNHWRNVEPRRSSRHQQQQEYSDPGQGGSSDYPEWRNQDEDRYSSASSHSSHHHSNSSRSGSSLDDEQFAMSMGRIRGGNRSNNSSYNNPRRHYNDDGYYNRQQGGFNNGYNQGYGGYNNSFNQGYGRPPQQGYRHQNYNNSYGNSYSNNYGSNNSNKDNYGSFGHQHATDYHDNSYRNNPEKQNSGRSNKSHKHQNGRKEKDSVNDHCSNQENGQKRKRAISNKD